MASPTAPIVQDTEHDALGRVSRRSRAYFVGDGAQWTSLAYDALGRVKRETRADGSRTERLYDGVVSGRVRERTLVYASASTPASQARTTTGETDALGRLMRVSDPQSNRTTYVYDALGHLRTTTDASGHVTTLTHDLRGRKTSMTDPDMGGWSYTYNALGELTAQSDAKGQTVTMAYDKLGRMTTRTEAEGTTTWTYDTATKGKGRLHTVSAPGAVVRTHAYDAYTRPASETTTVGTQTFTLSRTYDGAGRVAKLTYPKTGFAVEHLYTASGYLGAVRNAATPATVYWEARALSAEGQVAEARYGNGVGTTRTYDAQTGRVQSIQSGPGVSTTVQDLGYVFDTAGNLTTREDFRAGVYERFTYDTLERLTAATVHDATTDTALASKSYTYDAIGNLVTKSDVSAAAYVYGAGNAAGAGDAGPHAVVSAGSHTYTYDDNGNLLTGAGRTLTWTSFNKPKTVASTTTTTTFAYGPERARIRQTQAQGASTTTITYIGVVYEHITRTGEAAKRVHYVFAGARRIAAFTQDDAPTPSETLRYLHHDHLGSVDTITGATGTVLERLSYDAFGKRRTASGTSVWRDAALAITGAETRRGFTDHEHLDAFALIHMNGRVYDPHLGRFLSADPFIQFPASTQGLNRYSYVLNNPLSLTDPSGYFSLGSLFKPFRNVAQGVVKAVKRIIRSKVVQTVVTIAAGAYCGAQCAAAASAAFAATNGGDLGEVVFAATLTYVSAVAYSEVGTHVSHGAAKTVAHGVVGGVVAEVGGGRFRDGFIAAASAQFAAPGIGRFSTPQGRVVAAAVVGGTAARLGGGKFANGAATAAFARLSGEWAANAQTQTTLSVDARTVVELRHRRILPWLGPLSPLHTYVVVTDQVTDVQVVFRAGPSGRLLQDGSFGTIHARGPERYARGHIDYTTTHVSSAIVFQANASASSVVSTLTTYVGLVNSSVIPYSPWSMNSNSFAYGAVEFLGVPRPTTYGFTLGAQTVLGF